MGAERCPICNAEAPTTGNPHRPFCSNRCRLIDLSAWTSQRYRIAGEPVPAADPTPDDDA